MFPVARKHDIGMLVQVPHASGLSEGGVQQDTTFAPGDQRNWGVTTNEKRKGWLEDGLRKVESPGFLLEGRSRRQPAVQFILHESAVASVLPNIYDEATLRDVAAFDSGRALSEAEYERVQALHSRDFRPLAATQV